MSDLKLVLDPETNQYDVSLKDGDLEGDDSFETDLIVSLYTDARADRSEQPIPELRRGWWGDEVSNIPGSKIGSKFWLLDQARLTTDILNKGIDYGRLCLYWLVQQAYSKKVDVTGEIEYPYTINLAIKITNANGATESRAYKVWLNTGIQ